MLCISFRPNRIHHGTLTSQMNNNIFHFIRFVGFGKKIVLENLKFLNKNIVMLQCFKIGAI